MNVLVTGGAGYIGSVLVPELLREGYDVTVLDSLLYGGTGLAGVWDHPRFTFIQGDITDSQIVEESLFFMDHVVHLAALRHSDCEADPETAMAVNVDATKNLVEKAVTSGVKRFLFASSCSVYGINSWFALETSPTNPLTPYAIGKLEAEETILSYSKSLGILRQNPTVTILRFATAFGVSPNMRWNLLPNQFAAEALEREELHLYNPEASRTFLHVRDWARAIILFLNQKPHRINNRIFNVGKECKTKLEIANMLKKHVPDLKIHSEDGGRYSRDYRVNFQAVKKLGFRPVYDVKFGIFLLVKAIETGVI